MNNVDFFIQGCKVGAYKKKEWVLSLFCITELPVSKDLKHYRGRIYQHDGYPAFYRQDFDESAEPDELEWITLNGKKIEYIEKKENILLVNEEIEVGPKDIPNLAKEIKTTPGIFFINYYCIVDALQHKYPYQEGPELSAGKIASRIAPLSIDDPEEDKEGDPEKIYVRDVKKMLSAMSALSGFVLVNSPSCTPYTMSKAPGITELKKKLLKENEDKLHDPVVISQIEKELVAHDKAYLQKDPHWGFYINEKKGIGTARKKLHVMQGLQFRMDASKPPVLIENSLNEPLDVSKFPAIADGIRDGSYSRGAMTALGGEAVKFIYRIYSAAEIIKEDCGTPLGVIRTIHPEYIGRFTGSYIINKDGSNTLITPDNVQSYVGQTVMMRSPAFCKADPEGRGYCNKCFGESMRGYEKSLASYGAAVGSEMNGRFMGAMHVVVTTSTPLDIDRAIS